MSTPILDPELFDDPRFNNPRRCWSAAGTKKVLNRNGKLKTVEITQYINASRYSVAQRVARRWLGGLGYKLSYVHEITWNEYARRLPQEYVSWTKAAS